MKVELKVEQVVEVEVTKSNLDKMVDSYLASVLDKECFYYTSIVNGEIKVKKVKPDESSYSYYDDCYRRNIELTPTKKELELASLLYYKSHRYGCCK